MHVVYTHVHRYIHLCHMQMPEEEVFFFIPDLIPLRLDLSLNLEVGDQQASVTHGHQLLLPLDYVNTHDHAQLSSFSHGCRDLSSGSRACAGSTLVH